MSQKGVVSWCCKKVPFQGVVKRCLLRCRKTPNRLQLILFLWAAVRAKVKTVLRQIHFIECKTKREKLLLDPYVEIVDTNSDPVYLGAVGPVVDDLLVELTSHSCSSPDILTTEYISRYLE